MITIFCQKLNYSPALVLEFKSVLFELSVLVVEELELSTPPFELISEVELELLIVLLWSEESDEVAVVVPEFVFEALLSLCTL